MIHRIEIENFRSIRERQVIDLTVGPKVPSEPGRLEPIFDGAELRAPRVVAVYGANASGKTNLLLALRFVGWFVRSSFLHESDEGRLPYEKFLTHEMEAKPTRFEIHFSGPSDLKEPEGSPTCLYKYLLELSSREYGQEDRVLSESVKYRPANKGRFRRVFERGEKGLIFAAPEMKLALKNSSLISAFQRPDASILSIMTRLHHKIAYAIVDSIGRISSNIRIGRRRFYNPYISSFMTPFGHSVRENPTDLNREIRRADLGLKEVKFRRDEETKKIHIEFMHQGLDEAVDFSEESHGTKKFMDYFNSFHQVFTRGRLAVFDEIDASLHPILIREISRWFADKDRNPRGAQIWMSCQDPTLMDNLLKEEIFFCEKNSQGESKIYGLKEIGGVRRDENFKENYLSGVYGGVPQYG